MQAAPGGLGPLLADAAASHAGRPAIWADGSSHTYGDLLSRVAAYQSAAWRRGLTSTDRVVFIGRPGVDFYAAFIAGIFGSYTVSFVSDAVPRLARAHLVRALDPALILVTPDRVRADQVSGLGRRVDTTDAVVRRSPRAEPSVAATAHAYLSMTSGTLGIPTSALVDSVAAAEFHRWAGAELDMSETDRWFEAGDPTTDLALTNALLAFTSGASFTVVRADQRLRMASIAAVLRPTAIRWVPAAARLMMNSAARTATRLPSLRLLAYGGDALPKALPARVNQALGASPRTVNTYGLTEAAGILLSHWIDPRSSQDLPTDLVPLGRPVPGVSAFIDTEGQRDGEADLAPESIGDGVGELVVTTRAVALRTSIGFPGQAPILSKPIAGAKATLRTGDLVRDGAHGLEFVGRADREVKLNGFRANLEHLELAISEVLATPTCAIVEQDQLVAIVESASALSVERLARLLEDRIPAALLPRAVVNVHELPRTRSGKADIGACRNIVAELSRR